MNIFWSKVDKSSEVDGCWDWNGSILKGYGEFKSKGRSRLAHRTAYELFYNRKLTPEEKVLHKCDNPKCCNPHHLFLGSYELNNKDRDDKGRTAKGSSHGMAKLTETQVATIKYHSSEKSGKELAEEYHVSPGTISMIRTGYKWSHA